MYNFKEEKSFVFSNEDVKNRVPLYLKEMQDATAGGLPCGDTAFVLAESGRGKSTLIDNMAMDTGKYFHEKQPESWVYLFLLEETARERVKRMLQAHNLMSLPELKRQSSLVLPNMNLLIIEPLDFTPTMQGIRDKIEEMSVNHPIGMLYLDYMGELQGVLGQEHSAFTIAGRNFKEIALAYNIPCVSGAQAVKGETFSYEDGHLLDERNIGGAKALRNNASLFFSINRTKTQSESNLATINVFKNRLGPTGNFDVYMDLSKFYIGDI